MVTSMKCGEHNLEKKKSYTQPCHSCGGKKGLEYPAKKPLLPRRKTYIVNVSCVGQKDPCGILGKPRAESDWNFRLNVVSFSTFLPACPFRAGGEEADIRASHPSDKQRMRWCR